jgi:multisubunit Na+/H+ antiporter MnhB subunit
MIFRKLERAHEKKVAAAMMLIAIGLGFLIIGIAWPRHPLPTAHLGTDWNDFLHGVMIGIAIALETGGLVIGISAAAVKRAAKL